jgi:hypothetical protein
MPRNLTVRRAVWALVAIGTAIRLVLAFTTDGQPYDIQFLRDLRAALDHAPLDVYVTGMGPGRIAHWPYGPGFFPFAWLAGAVSSVTGLAYSSLVRVPSIAADAAIAWIVQDFLRVRGARDLERVAATALVALGPSFIVISGYHGQIDSVAILPAVAAIAFWDRMPPGRRAIYAGLLIGAAATIKTTPGFMLLALLPAVASWREAAKLIAATAAFPLVVTAPWLLHTPHQLVDALHYRGFPGTSGLSILLQPRLAEQLTHSVTPNGAVDFIYQHGQPIVALVLVAVTAAAVRWRPAWTPEQRATVIWLAFYVVTPAFFFQYLVWGLPFFILARRLSLAAGVQAVALVPTILFYGAPWKSRTVAIPYAIGMLALWATFVFNAATAGWSATRRAAFWAARDLPRIAWLTLIGAFVAFTTVPLAAMLRVAVVHDVSFPGGEGPFPGDQYQYMAWIREYGSHLLASNTLDIAPSAHVFLHPMFILSGLGVRLGMSTGLAYLLWKPVALAALFFGFDRYVRRFVEGTWTRLAALAIALFFSAPAVLDFFSLGGGDFLNQTGELLPSMLLWGYLPGAISVALVPLFLLGIERLATSPQPGAGHVALVSACGVVCAWLHPWQGEVVLVTVAVAIAADRGARRKRVLAIPLAATLAPLVYYFVLSRVDSAWELAQKANERAGDPRAWTVFVALIPLAVPAALALRRRGVAGLGERMLAVWPVACVVVFLFLSPSFRQHALEGASLPLAILAVRGLAFVPYRAIALWGFVALVTIPGAIYMVDWFRDTVRAGGQVRYLQPGESAALRYLHQSGESGGVLTNANFGTLVPAATGRQSWVGHPSWTRDYAARAREVEELFAGRLPAPQAAGLIRTSGARYVFVGCANALTAAPVLQPLSSASHRFGCAIVYRVTS